MNVLFLKFILLFKSLWTSLGVDPKLLETILQTKLKMDDRTPMTSFGRQKEQKPTTFATVFQFVMLILLGSVFLLFFFYVDDRFTALSLYFLSFMSVLALTLVADFSTILLDTRDQYIILPRPVNDRTVAMARILHMGIKLMSQLIGLAIPGIICVLFLWGWVPMLLFIMQVFIAGLMSLLIINIFYLAFLRFLSIQRFKDMVSYLQIFLSIFIFAAYYVGPRLLESQFVQEIRIPNMPALWLVPAVWVAALQELLGGNISMLTILLSALAIATPLLAFGLATNIFSSGFNAKLAGLSIGDTPKNNKAEADGQKQPFYKLLARWLTNSPLENAGFDLLWGMTSRTREFKQQLYPSLAYIPMYFFFLFFNGKGEEGKSVKERIADLDHSGLYIVMFYFSILSLISVLQLVTKSDRYKAAWIYYVAPMRHPGHLMSGVLKACLVKFYLPFSLFFLAISLPLFGPKIINDILLSMAFGGIEAVLLTLFLVKSYPFSRPMTKGESKFITNLVVMGFIGVLGLIHYAIVQYELLVWGATFLCWLIFLLMLHYFKKDKWTSLAYDD
ncbi:hypothetical protein [Olivibacter sitiensis]|uniref:hypothetical protein n=1 Tax=Olivibacter sitiensis TaxID=376470 RepID=UPI0003FC1827|nr:hypothetical protein [Olivibacter sitiensis]